MERKNLSWSGRLSRTDPIAWQICTRASTNKIPGAVEQRCCIRFPSSVRSRVPQVRARFWALTWARNARLEPRVYRLALERQYSENAFVYSTQWFLMDEPF